MRLDFRQTTPDGEWLPWEEVEGDLLDKAVETVLAAHFHIVGEEAVAVLLTAWDGSMTEFMLVKDAYDA